MRLIVTWILYALAVLAAAYLLPGIAVTGFWGALIVALVLGLLNAFVKPILSALALPITVLTLGLFSFVINAIMVMVTDYFVDSFFVENFWWALLFSLLLSIVYGIIGSIWNRISRED